MEPCQLGCILGTDRPHVRGVSVAKGDVRLPGGRIALVRIFADHQGSCRGCQLTSDELSEHEGLVALNAVSRLIHDLDTCIGSQTAQLGHILGVGDRAVATS